MAGTSSYTRATTIDQFELSAYNTYALRAHMVEQINREFGLDKASSIPPQTALITFYPKPAEIDILLGITPIYTPWAYFYPPKNFRYQRRSPFAFHRVVPTLGSLKDQEKDEEKLATFICSTEEEESEKAAISGCLKQIDKLNGWLGFIVGRVGQFLQG